MAGDSAGSKLDKAEKIVSSATQMTRQLLGYAREGRYETKPLDLNQLVRESAEIFAVTRKDIDVRRDLSPGLSCIKADKSQIEQILWNLFINAADAMPCGGEIFIEVSNVKNPPLPREPGKIGDGPCVRLTVRDTGTGMDKMTADQVFEPFFSTKGTSGLGLALSWGIVERHRGMQRATVVTAVPLADDLA